MWKMFFGSGCAVFLGLIILGAGCTFDKPVNPSWDVQLVIPLAEKRYNLIDLVDTLEANGTLEFGIGYREDDSLLFFFYQDSIPHTTIGDSLYIAPQEDSITTGLGTVYFEADVNDSADFSFGRVNPAVVAHHGEMWPVPSFDSGPIYDDLAPIQRLEYVLVDSGYLHYSVVNNLPVDFSNLHITFFRTSFPDSILLEDDVAYIAAHSSVIDSVNLRGTRIVRWMSVSVSGTSPGSSTTVEIDTTDNLGIHVQMDRLKVTEARGYFPAQSISQDSTVSFESEHTIREAGIRTGAIHFQSINETQVSTLLRVTVFNFTSPTGDPLVSEAYLDAGQALDTSIVLDGYSLEFPDPENQTLHVLAEAVFDSSEEEITYESGQEAFATYQTDSLMLEYIDGILDTISLVVEPTEQEVEQLPEGWDHLTLVGAAIRLTLDSDIEANIYADIHLVAIRDGIARDSVIIQETIVPNQDTLLTIEGLERLINARPDLVRLYGRTSTYGDLHLEADNHVQGFVVLDAPINFTLEPTTINGNIDEIADPIDEPVKRAQVEATIYNHLPLSGELVVLAANDSVLLRNDPVAADTLLTAQLTLPVISSGRVIEPIESDLTIKLLQEQIDLFRTAPTYILTVFHLDGTGTDTLSAHASDYLGISAIGRFIYEIDTGD